jgi:predicted nucleotide-binding protein
MARRPPDLPKDVQLTPQQIRAAISRFERRIKEVEAFEPEKVTDRRDPQIDALEAAIGEALTEAFGEETPIRQRYSAAASLDTAGISMNGTPHHEVIDGLIYGKRRALTLMNQAIRSLEERLADYVPVEQVELTNGPPSKDVFVVHGHDDEFKREVADVLRRAGLTPVILHEQPNGGKTIIEKFEKHGGGAGFAVVLLTPDDVGGPSADQLHPRARQNVIGEMFWFAGKLGRSKVCALKKGELEVPSDFAGVVYTPVDERGAWKTDLLKELQTAGYTDLNWGLALS